MSNYYASIIRATRSSANAVSAMTRINRHIADALHAGRDCTALKRAYTNAYARYMRAQDVLSRHPLSGSDDYPRRSRPLSAADIAARVASYPHAKES